MQVFWDLWIRWSNCPYFVAKKDLHWIYLVEKGKSVFSCQDAKFCSTPSMNRVNSNTTEWCSQQTNIQRFPTFEKIPNTFVILYIFFKDLLRTLNKTVEVIKFSLLSALCIVRWCHLYFFHQVMPLASVSCFCTRWRHLHCNIGIARSITIKMYLTQRTKFSTW